MTQYYMCVNAAAVRQQYPTVSEESIKLKIGQFVAQSQDRDGGRKDRELRKSAAAACSSASSVDEDNTSNDDIERLPTPAADVPSLPSLP